MEYFKRRATLLSQMICNVDQRPEPDTDDLEFSIPCLSIMGCSRCDGCGKKAAHNCRQCGTIFCGDACRCNHACYSLEDVSLLVSQSAGTLRMFGFAYTILHCRGFLRAARDNCYSAIEWISSYLKAWRHNDNFGIDKFIEMMQADDGIPRCNEHVLYDTSSCRSTAGGIFVAAMPLSDRIKEQLVQGYAAVFATNVPVLPGRVQVFQCFPTNGYQPGHAWGADWYDAIVQSGPFNRPEMLLVQIGDNGKLDAPHQFAALPTGADPVAATKAHHANYVRGSMITRRASLCHTFLIVCMGGKAMIVQSFYSMYSAAAWLRFDTPLTALPLQRHADFRIVKNAYFRKVLEWPDLLLLFRKILFLGQATPARLWSDAGMRSYGHVTGVCVKPPTTVQPDDRLSISISRCQFSARSLFANVNRVKALRRGSKF